MGRRSKSRILGNVSLGVMVGGMVVMEGLLHTHILAGPGWRILATGFEAGTIGALADWYAVRAMFHYVPIPILGKHSDILVRNRARITDALVDAVQNKWLSSQAISQFLEQQSPATLVMEYLGDPQHQAQLVSGARAAATSALARVDSRPIEALLEQAIRDQIVTIPIAQPLGRWLTRAIENNEHHALWEALLGTLEQAVSDRHTQTLIAGVLHRTASRYAEAGAVKRMGKRMMEAAGVIDYDAMAHAAVAEARLFVDAARSNPDHPLRQKLDHTLLGWAHALQSGEADAVQQVHQWRDRLAAQAQLGPIVQSMLARLRQTLGEQLASDQGKISAIMESWLTQQVQELQASDDRQAKINSWARQRVPELVARYSHVIGDVVRGKLAAAADQQWVSEIEDNVGDDLQYIRLNGAVVGFGVGLILATIRWGMTWAG